MSGYLKKIALIKQLKSGFSADGGALSGLFKAEAYAGFLKVEVSLLNFAPLTEGRYVFGISDGQTCVIFDGAAYEGESPLDLSRGFAAIVCFCHNGVFPVASALNGELGWALPSLKNAIAEQESVPPAGAESAYNDEAIAEVNYYKFEADEGGKPVCADKKEEENGISCGEDEAHTRPYKEGGQDLALPQNFAQSENYKTEETQNINAAENDFTRGGESTRKEDYNARAEEKITAEAGSAANGREAVGSTESKDNASGGAEIADGISAEYDGARDNINLAGGAFYERMRGEIENIFSSYPKEEKLERVIEGSRWARIDYGEGNFYAFGVIYAEGEAQFICYGVPSRRSDVPPESLKGRASFIPVEGGGFWVMYQDARTGVSVKISVS